MASMKLSAIILMGLWCLVPESEACVCMPSHPQTAFCNSDFAVKVGVVSGRRYRYPDNYKLYLDLGFDPPREVFYDVVIVKVFKGGDRIVKLLNTTNNVRKTGKNGRVGSVYYKATIHTSGSSCGSFLRKGDKYLLTGRIIRNRLSIGSCDWKMEWNMLTEEQRRGFHGKYDCDCKVASCMDGYCDHPNTECKMEFSWDTPVDPCSLKHQSCRKVGGVCRWHNHRDFFKCESVVEP